VPPGASAFAQAVAASPDTQSSASLGWGRPAAATAALHSPIVVTTVAPSSLSSRSVAALQAEVGMSSFDRGCGRKEAGRQERSRWCLREALSNQQLTLRQHLPSWLQCCCLASWLPAHLSGRSRMMLMVLMPRDLASWMMSCRQGRQQKQEAATSVGH
jgi:hypothetical protein